MQEQVKNIAKYAEASKIEVSLTRSGSTISMRIFDNGKGFDVKTAKKGIGLSNIKKRAESLSGKFILNSAPGKGCEIIVEIPVGVYILSAQKPGNDDNQSSTRLQNKRKYSA
jgi:signal transduction histidine kinase